MEGFGTHLNRLGNGVCPQRHDHKLLNIQIVGRMCPAIDDIHHRYWQVAGIDAAKISVKRQAVRCGGGARGRHRYPKYGIRTKL